MRAVFQSILQSIAVNNPAAVVLVIDAPHHLKHLIGQRLLVTPQGKEGFPDAPDWLKEEAVRAAGEVLTARQEGRYCQIKVPGSQDLVNLFIDLALPLPQLLIFGGGHISQPLTVIGALAGFQVTVVDDRPLFANRQRFPDAYEVICCDFKGALSRVSIHSETYIVIVTRGHKSDEECLRGVLGSRAAYIGMIGSRRRVRGIMNRLAEEGIDKTTLGRIFSPIGLSIGAQTPGEIAVSIMAEVISVRRQGRGGEISLKEGR
ncbi:MAG: XdhC family protein [Bacillota bacterium]